MSLKDLSKEQLIQEVHKSEQKVEELKKKLQLSQTEISSIFQKLSRPAIIHERNLDLSNRLGKIVKANKQALELTNYKEDEIRSLHFLDIPKNKLRKQKQDDIINAIKKEGQCKFHFQIEGDDRRTHYIESNTKNIILHGQELLLSLFRDYSRCRAMRKEIKKGNEKYQTYFKFAPLPYQYLDKNGKITDINQKWLEEFGYIRDEVLQRNFNDFLHLDDIEKFQTDFAELLSQGEIQNVKYRIKHKHGSFVDVSFNGYIGHDSKGQITKIYCVLQNITEQKRLEESLEHIENNYRYLIQASSNHVFMLTTDGYFLLSNNNVQQFGLQKGSELIGRNVLEIYELKTAKLFQQKIKKVLSIKQTVNFEYSIQTKEDRRYFLSTLYPVVKGRKLLGIGGIVQDITERKKSKIQLQNTMNYLNSVEEKFRKKAAQKLHDHVGQNLTGLNLNLNFIYSALPEKSQQLIESKYYDSTELLNDTIESIRDLISEMRPSILENHGLYAALEWYAEKVSKRANIDYIMKGEELSGALSNGLETHLFRISEEIFNNIVKHSKAENIEIELRERKDKIKLQIKDDGIGMNIEEIEDDQNSTGFGLLSMKDRVTAMGGDFILESEPGKGTSIKIIVEK